MTRSPRSLTDPQFEHRPAGGRRFAGSAFGLLLGVAGVIGSVRLGIGSPGQPAPGLWPLMVSVCICIFAALSLVADRTTMPPTQLPHLRVGVATLTLALFIVAFGYFGILLPVFAVLLVWLRFIWRESWRMSVLVAVIGAAAFHLLFAVLLGVPLATGPLVFGV